MKTLLIGARGQLGTDLQLLDKDRFIAWTSEEIDLLDLKTLESKLKDISADAIVNCAAYNKTEQAEFEPKIAYTVNGHAVGIMAEVAKKRDIPFVHISSDFVFDGEKGSPYVETDATAPLSVYGASKAFGEAVALCHSAYVLRTASLFGASGSREKKGNFVDAIVAKGKAAGPIKVVNDIWMSPTSTEDLAKAILTLLDKLPVVGLYHAVNTGSASWFTFAQEIGRQLGFLERVEPTSREAFPSKIRRPVFAALSNEKIGKIAPFRPWEEALTDYIQRRK